MQKCLMEIAHWSRNEGLKSHAVRNACISITLLNWDILCTSIIEEEEEKKPYDRKHRGGVTVMSMIIDASNDLSNVTYFILL